MMKILSIIATALVSCVVALEIVFVSSSGARLGFNITTLCLSGTLLMYCILTIIYYFKKWTPKKINYYIFVNGQRRGPYMKEDLRMLGIKPTTWVWHKGLYNWVKAESLYDLLDLFGIVPPPPKSRGKKGFALVMTIISSISIALSGSMGIMGILIASYKDYDDGLFIVGGLFIHAVAAAILVFSLFTLLNSMRRMKQA